MNQPSDPSPWARLRLLPVLFVIGLFAVVWWRGQPKRHAASSAAPSAAARHLVEGKMTVLRGQIFGTTYTIKLSEVLDEVARAALQANIERRLAEIDEAMSTYKPSSEVSRFNALPLGGSVTVSTATAEVLEVAGHVSARSGGAFDVTVGPLVNAWGFGPSPATDQPTAAQLSKLRGQVGFTKVLSFDEDHRTLVKRVAGARLDLSAVAKGYAVDRVAKVIRDQEFKGAMVEIGGEIAVFGERPEGGPWRLGIERPQALGSAVYEVIPSERGALATSGDYRNFRKVAGKVVSHTIDPRTGEPVQHKVSSVSVLADSCAAADAWATALNVLGDKEGLAVADKEGIAVLFLVRDGDALKRVVSRAWPPYARRIGGQDPSKKSKD